MVETAMVLPWLFLVIFVISQLTLYLFTKSVVHYAAFMAARSAVVYDKATLDSIKYPYVGNGSETDADQMIVEATAERIIFESLPWENSKIRELKSGDPLERVYYDPKGQHGAVRIISVEKDKKQASIELVYCMPVLFGLQKLFQEEGINQQCRNINKPDGGMYDGLPIRERVSLGL